MTAGFVRPADTRYRPIKPYECTSEDTGTDSEAARPAGGCRAGASPVPGRI